MIRRRNKARKDKNVLNQQIKKINEGQIKNSFYIDFH
jgi:hypothetical protein